MVLDIYGKIIRSGIASLPHEQRLPLLRRWLDNHAKLFEVEGNSPEAMDLQRALEPIGRAAHAVPETDQAALQEQMLGEVSALEQELQQTSNAVATVDKRDRRPRPSSHRIPGTKGQIVDTRFFYGGAKLYSVDAHGKVDIRKAGSWKKLMAPKWQVHPEGAESVIPRLSPDGKWLCTAGSTSEILFTPTDGSSPPRSFRAQSGRAIEVSFSADSSHVAVAGVSGFGVVLAKADGSDARQVLTDKIITQAYLSPQGKTLATMVFSDVQAGRPQFELWDVSSNDPTRIGEHVLRDSDTFLPDYGRFSPDGKKFVISASGYKNIRILEGENFGFLADTTTGGPNRSKPEFSPDGKAIVIGSMNSELRIIDSETGKTLSSVYSPLPISSTHFSADGRTLLALSAHRGISLWSIENNRFKSDVPIFVQSDPRVGNPVLAEISSNGRYIVFGAVTNGLRVVDREQLKQAGEILR